MNIAEVKAALKSREPRGEKSEQEGERSSLPGCDKNTENITRQGSAHNKLPKKFIVTT